LVPRLAAGRPWCDGVNASILNEGARSARRLGSLHTDRRILMLDVEDWIDVHESDLHDLAQRVGLHDGTMHFVAALVLGGHTDDVVYEQLQDLAGSPESRPRQPVDAPALVAEVRKLAGRHQSGSDESPSGRSGLEVGHHVGSGADGWHIEAWAPSRSRCLEEVVRGVVETFADADPDRSRAQREVPLEIGAALDEDVVTMLFGDVRRLLVEDGLVVVDVVLDEEDDGNFDGTFFVVPLASVVTTDATPKLARVDSEFVYDGSLWRARVSVDAGSHQPTHPEKGLEP
jgi:hypothetical protein